MNISEPQLFVIFRQAFELGILKPRNENIALKPRVPNGQGKSKYIPTGVGKGGANCKRKKFSDEQEQEIAKDYYENGFTLKQLKEKWQIHPVQLQRIRNTYGKNYAPKDDPRKRVVQQFDKQGNLLNEFECGLQASKVTGIHYENLNACCNGRVKSAGGFVWKLKQDTK